MGKKKRFIHASAVFVAALMLLAPLSLCGIFEEKEAYKNVTSKNILGENSFTIDYSNREKISISEISINGENKICRATNPNTPLDASKIVITIGNSENASDDLVKFSELVNGVSSDSHDFSGYTVILTKDIVLSNPVDPKTSNLNPIGKGEYDPISREYYLTFEGTFDGQGYTISNLNLVSEVNKTVYVGLFGCIGTNGTVKNVGLIDSSINVTVTANVDADSTDDATSIAYVGLIAGRNGGTIENCYSTANITVAAEAIDDNESTEINATSYASAGGIAGVNVGSIQNCYNAGDVTDTATTSSKTYDAYVGGIAGSNYKGTIQNCYNAGDVTAKCAYNAYVGGIAGWNNISTIQNCYNTGDVCAIAKNSSFAYTGGIAGGNYGGGIIQYCYNTGGVCATAKDSSSAFAGGIAGENHAAHDDETTIQYCYNTGTVSATVTSTSYIAYAGGIAGLNGGMSTKIENCYNTGNVTATISATSTYYNACAGGIVGSNGGTIENCYNIGNVTANDSYIAYVGGIAGSNYGIIENCYNTGDACATAKDSPSAYAGGIVGWNYRIITNTYYAYDSEINGASSGEIDGTIGLLKDEMTGLQLISDKLNKAEWSPDIFNVNEGLPVLANVPSFSTSSELKSSVYITVSFEKEQTDNFLNVAYVGNPTINANLSEYVLPNGMSETCSIKYQWYKYGSSGVLKESDKPDYKTSGEEITTYYVKVTFSEGENEYTYTSFSRTVKILEDGYHSLQFNVTPSDATVVVTDADNETIPDLNGSYILEKGETYSHTISKSGYNSQSGTISEIGNDMIINISLSRPTSVTPTIPTELTADANGNVAIPNKTINDAVNEAKNSESNEVIVDVSNVEGASSTTISSTSINTLLEELEETPIDTLTISLPEGNVSLNKETLSELSQEALKISIEEVSESIELTEEQKEMIGNSRIYEIEVYSGSNKITEFNDSIEISLPYELKEGESAGNIIVYYVKDDGTLEKIECTYENGFATFTINHLSNFSVVHATSESVGPETPKQNDNTLYYAIAVVIVVLVLMAAFYFIRKK